MKIRRFNDLAVPVLLALVILPGLALSQEPAAAKQPAAVEPPAAVPEPAVVQEPAAAQDQASSATASEQAAAKAPASPLMRDIRALWTARQGEVAALEQSFRVANGEAEALAIQRRIEEILVQTEFDILQLQADHARREGRAADAERIEAEIAAARALPDQKPLPAEKRAPRTDGDQPVR